MAESTVFAIFPTPIYTTECDIDISKAVEFLKGNHEMLANNYAHLYGNKSVEDYLLSCAECKELKNFILFHVEKYASEIMAWDFKRFEITQSWLTIKNPSEEHGLHYHPNSVLSGVFYFDEYEKYTSNLVFHRPAIISQLMNQFAPTVDRAKMNNTEFPWNEWEMSPKTNQLILFPSWLSHSVKRNTTDNVRKCLAFNAVPADRFGTKTDATEIDFKRLV